ncbi:MAG: hypothetical protein GY930_01060 [bacterium]|nr:hypothetical protein [bacterium]
MSRFERPGAESGAGAGAGAGADAEPEPGAGKQPAILGMRRFDDRGQAVRDVAHHG